MAHILTIEIREDLSVIARSDEDAHAIWQIDQFVLRSDPLKGLLDLIANRKATAKETSDAGDQLFRALFGDSIRTLLGKLEERALSEGVILYIRLLLSSPWHTLPWELMRNPDTTEFLAAAKNKALFRVNSGKDLPPAVTSSQMVLLAAGPMDQVPLSIDGEASLLIDLLSSDTPGAPLLVEIEDRATRSQLLKILSDTRPGILHLICHGDFNGTVGKIALLATDGSTDWLTEDDLANALAGCSHLSLVVLNSCLTASSSTSSVVSGIGARLVQLGLRSVIAMQYTLQDSSAVAFSEKLYRAISAGATIPIAIQTARRHLLVSLPDNNRDAFAPVLYLRGFPFGLCQPTTSASQASARPLVQGVIPKPGQFYEPPAGLLQMIGTSLESVGKVLLSSEGGYGKTQLSREIARTYDGSVVWVDCQAGHADELSLVADLTERIRIQVRLDFVSLSRLLTDPEISKSPIYRIPGQLTAALVTEMEKVASPPILIVLDDIHLLPPLVADAVIPKLLRSQFQSVKFILITGGAEPDSLRREVEDGNITRYGRKDLAVSVDETGRSLRARFNVDVADELIAKLVEASEGWPMMLSLIGPDDVGSAESIEQLVVELRSSKGSVYDALLRRAYSRQDESTRSTLRVLSIPPRITTTWTNSVLDAPSGGALLRALELKNAFVMPDATEPDAWRLHSLFRAFLKTRLMDEDASAAEGFFAKSAAYWRDRGDLLSLTLESMDHSRFSEAAQALEELAPDALRLGRMTVLTELWSRIPSKVRASRAFLAVHVSQAFAALGLNGEAMKVLDEIHDWTTLGVGEDIVLVLRLGLTATHSEDERVAKAQQADVIFRRSQKAGVLQVASQALLKKAEFLHNQAVVDSAIEAELINDLRQMAGMLENQSESASVDVKAHLLASAVHFMGLRDRREMLAAMSAIRIGADIGMYVAEHRSRLVELQSALIETSRLAACAEATAMQASSELALADVVYECTCSLADTLLIQERMRRVFRFQDNVDVTVDLQEHLSQHLRRFMACEETYRQCESRGNVAMVGLMVARTLRLMGDLVASNAALANSVTIARELNRPDIVRNAESIRQGLYDFDYPERQIAAIDFETGLADYDDKMLEELAIGLSKAWPNGQYEEVLLQSRISLQEERSLHVARRSYCEFLNCADTEPAEVAAYLKDPAVQRRNMRVHCRMFPDRVSSSAGTNFDRLFAEFRQTFCEGCSSRQPKK